MLQLTATKLQQGKQRESPGRGRHEDQAELKQQFSVQIEDRMQAATYGEKLHVASVLAAAADLTAGYRVLTQEADSAPGPGYCEGEGGAGGGAGAGSRAAHSDETLELSARRNKPEREEEEVKTM